MRTVDRDPDVQAIRSLFSPDLIFFRTSASREDWIDVATYGAGAVLAGAGALWSFHDIVFATIFIAVALILIGLATAHLLGPLRRGSALIVSPDRLVLLLRTKTTILAQQVASARMADERLLLRLKDDSVVSVPSPLDPGSAFEYITKHWPLSRAL